ncbi:MAG: carboxypeptidase-like regulatory domain-containing protein, partial [Candidatus Acidiferrales bacterium]
MNWKRVIFMVFAALLLLPGVSLAQSVVTGGIAGVVTDPTGAVIVGARITLTNAATGETQTVTSASTGSYSIPLLKPGHYEISVSQQGFKASSLGVDVVLGQITAANVKLEIGSGSTTVEVTENGALLQTEDANISTTFDSRQMQETPNPGGDVTYIANTAPGIVANNSTVGGYGNFSAFGLPADANLFTINGNDYNDPFLNLNNTGASNLLLGGNEMQEVAIVANGYTGQYGRQAGAQVDYSTKSGGNAFHGDAVYFWTGRELTANDPINKLFGGTRPFANNNQWAAALGGPIKKDKAFFFVNTEGIRYIFGSVHTPTLMTPAFQDYVLSNISTSSFYNATTPAFYNNVFSLYNAAPGIAKAVPNTGGAYSAAAPTAPLGSCLNFAYNPLTNLISDPISGAVLPAALQPTAADGSGGGGCTETYTQSVSNGNKEWLLSGRVDYSFSDNDKIFGRVKFDRGLQPTYTDSINPAFNDSSNQPQDEGQLNYTHIFSPTVVNNFIGSVLYYAAIFGSTNPGPALALFPGNLAFIDGSATTALGTGSGNPGGFAQGFLYPQGRHVTQWQLIDDVAVTRGNHGFKMGVNFRRDDVSDYTSAEQTEYPGISTSLLAFANDQVFAAGPGGSVTYNFAVSNHQPIAFYSFGLYFQDEWRVNSKLKMTLTLRADRNSGGACQSNCATLPVTPFSDMPHGADVPYNASFPGGSFQTGLKSILPNVEKVVFEPRFGFAWTPLGDKTVLRGGIGLFTDLYPGEILGNYTTNFPQVNAWNVAAGGLAFDLNAPASSAFPNSGVAVVQQCNGAFASNFASGGNLNSYQSLANSIPGNCLSAATGNLIVPNLADTTGKTLNPKYTEWNFEIQRTLARNTVMSIDYVGNHGFDELLTNPYLNSYCGTVCTGAGFVNTGLPTTPLDPRVANVLQLGNAGYSNYNGVTVSLQEKDWHGLSGTLNYTYSHSLDANSNGGINPFSVVNSILNQINPFNPRADYATSDNDVRHNVSANYIYALPFKTESKMLNYAVAGWQLSGHFFWHTGFPFSIVDGAAVAAIQGDNLEFSTVLAQPSSTFTTRSFTNSNPCATGLITGVPCFGFAGSGATNILNASTNFVGAVGRNAFVGPGFFGADFSIRKMFDITERLKFQIGFNAYN